MASDLRIVFEEHGYPRELISAQDRVRAVRDDSLTADMDVTVYRKDSRPEVMKARDIRELRPLFGIDEEDEVIPAEPAKRAPRATSGRARVKPAPAALPAAAAPQIEQPPPAPAEEQAPPPSPPPPWGIATPHHEEPAADPPRSYGVGTPLRIPPPREPGMPLGARVALIVIGVLVAAVLLGMWASAGDPNGSLDADAEETDTSEDMPADNDMMADAPVEGPVQTRYAVRDTFIRARATANSPKLGTLWRGESVTGVIVSGEVSQYAWMRISEGPYQGGFVSADANLSAEPRPSLDTSVAASYTVRNSAPVYAQPRRGSRVLQRAEPGLAINVMGRIDSDMVEISLRSGEIAYMDAAAFQSSAQAPPASYSDDMMAAEAEPAYSPPPPPPPPPSQATPPVMRNASQLSRPGTNRQGGIVGYIVMIDASGRLVDCRVTRSSGDDRLDTRTCAVLRTRGRFDPAVSSNGVATTGTISGTMTWTPRS